MDMRIYNSPLPPELKNKKNYVAGIKPDSIVNKLKPLIVYINESIIYEEKFKIKMNPIQRFEFIKNNYLTRSKNSIYLDIKTIEDKKGIILTSIGDKEFYDTYESLRLNDNYGGIMSFQNLFFSKDGSKAYFEINYFKGPLNSSFIAVYAEYNNGKWHFKSELISIG
jgi:hypothetical protein